MSDRIKFNKIDWDELAMGIALITLPAGSIVGLLVAGPPGLGFAVISWICLILTGFCVRLGLSGIKNGLSGK